MKSFEEGIRRLEELAEKIRRTDTGLEDALASYEEGIKLSKMLEKELDKIEGKVKILANSPLDEKEAGNDNAAPELDLFAQSETPSEGLRANA